MTLVGPDPDFIAIAVIIFLIVSFGLGYELGQFLAMQHVSQIADCSLCACKAVAV